MDLTLYDYSLFFFSIIDVYAFYRILNNKVTYRFPQRMLVLSFGMSYLLMLFVSYSNILFPNIPIKILFLFMFFASLYICFTGVPYKKILWIVVSFFALLACELLAMPFALLLTRTTFYELTQNPITQILATLLARCMLLLVVSLLIRSKKRIFESFSRDFFFIILTDVIYSLIVLGFFYFDNVYLTIDIAISLSVFVMFAITFLSLFLLRKITKKSDEIMTTNLKLQQIEMEHKQNEDIAIVVEDLRALRHDMNNHMSILQGLLTTQEYDEANNYLATITQELTVANTFIFTENKVLSVLLNNKSSKARSLKITFDAEIMTSTTPFTDPELCALVGNILENAIEASSGHACPYIFFSMRTQKNASGKQLLIQCDNTYTKTPVFKNGFLITTKEDKTYHGIGTKTIRSIAENYNGTADFSADEHFHVFISIPL